MLTVFFLIICLSFAPLNAAITPAADGTMWDKIMREQGRQSLSYGYSLLAKQEYSKAVSEFYSAITKMPKNAMSHIGYGSALYWLGAVDKAYEEFEIAIKLEPENATAYQLRGIVQARAGLYEKALADFLKAAKYAPERGDIRMNIGSIYAALGQMSTALVSYRRAVALEKYNPLFHFQLGQCYSSMGIYDKAEAEFKKAIAIYPMYEEAFFELALLKEKNEDYLEAIKFFRKAISLKPRDSVARFRLANLLYAMGSKTEIPKIVAKAFSIAPASKKEGISLGIAYSSSEKKDSKPKENKQSDDLRMKEMLEKIPNKGTAKVIIEVLELPKMQLSKIVMSETSKGKKLAMALKPPKYRKKEYILPVSSFEERNKKISEIIAETKELFKKTSDDYDLRVNMNVETSHVDSSDDNKAKYIPRDIGNDMGLWVTGENWLGNVSELVSDLALDKDSSYEFLLLRGLGYLIMGETSLALHDFSHKNEISALGRAAAYTASGNTEAAINACNEALSYNPKNKIALQNFKWLQDKSQLVK